MQCATEKIIRKIAQGKEKLHKKDAGMIIDDALITPELLLSVDKRTQKKLRRHFDDEEKILTSESLSCKTWKYVPRFHMDLIMGKTNDKKKKQERLDKILAKRK